MGERTSSIFRDVARRAIHLQIVPRPQNITESREILRLLSQFGEVEYFRSLRYDKKPTPHTAHAIFKDEHAAQHCLLRNPIRFQMGGPTSRTEMTAEQPTRERPLIGETSASLPATSEQPSNAMHEASSLASMYAASKQSSSRAAFGRGQTRCLTTDSLPRPPRATPSFPYAYDSSPIRMPAEHTMSEEDEEEFEPRIYQMYVNPAKEDFLQRAEMGYYHGGFVNDWRSVPNDDLRKRTPLKGMANLDWRKPTKSARTIAKERAMVRGQLGGLGKIYREAQQKQTGNG